MTARADVDVVVIGAGVVGLAAAAALARAGKSVIVFERHTAIAQETTTRNSEVVHAGIYYPNGSLKARLCVAGRRMLYERCAARGIAHRKLGKWIVATDDDELARLDELRARGIDNGVEGLDWVALETIRRAEPDLRVVGALLSLETGIVDGHALCLSYQAEAEAHGASLALAHDVASLAYTGSAWRVGVRDASGEAQTVLAAAVVNAAGLASDRIAELAGLDVDARDERIKLCKGDYFALAPSAPLRFSRLVYPVPAGPGLGIHATLDLGGRVRFGPDAHYVDAPTLEVDGRKAEDFARAIRRYVPSIEAGWLAPDYAGLRPKLAGPGQAFRDFVVREESAAGLPGLVDCMGIESPGLTASPAIAERIVSLLASL